MGHSFGSITAGWFVKANPERVSHMTLVDPVSLLLCLPDVGYTFLYRQPSTVMQWIIFLRFWCYSTSGKHSDLFS